MPDVVLVSGCQAADEKKTKECSRDELGARADCLVRLRIAPATSAVLRQKCGFRFDHKPRKFSMFVLNPGQKFEG